MKRNCICLILMMILIVLLGIINTGCVNTKVSEGILRLHIRANSNLDVDQEVKLKVRDQISIFLEKEMENETSLDEAKKKLQTLKDKLKEIADQTLTDNGFEYKSKVKINNEFFPTRLYEDLVVESGYYDALIITLGEGQGDNWWCVIYPPLCYIEAQFGNGFKYKSKIRELINKYFN